MVSMVAAVTFDKDVQASFEQALMLIGGVASYEKAFTERVVPFNLSTDMDTRDVRIGHEKISLSNVLFDPSVFVSIHAPRRFERGGALSRARHRVRRRPCLKGW